MENNFGAMGQAAGQEDVNKETSELDFVAQMKDENKKIYTMPDGTVTMHLTTQEYQDALEEYNNSQR